MRRSSGIGIRLTRLLASVLPTMSMIALSTPALAAEGDPEYAKLGVGDGVSVSGEVGADGLLIADDIERLPGGRSPKLRGTISDVDSSLSAVRMFGRLVTLDESTVLHRTGDPVRIADLTAGTRAELRCEVLADGSWHAESVAIGDVKSSDKIKGSVSAVILTRSEADTLDIDGLRIVLLPTTDVVDVESDYIADELFAELKSEDGMLDRGGEGLRIGEAMVLTGSLRQNTWIERGYRLQDEPADERRLTEPSMRLELAGRWTPRITTFVQLRAQRSWNLREAPGRDAGEQEWKLLARQAYAVFRDVGGGELSLVVGKQRIRDNREFLFDEYLDALRVYLHRLRPLVIELSYLPSIMPLKEKFSTWDDLLLQLRLFPDEDTRFNMYALRRWDSDDSRGREPLYLGFSFEAEPLNAVSTWIEASLLRGEDKGRRLNGHHVDLGITLRGRRLPLRPSVTGAFALGSGDASTRDGIDGNFQQTGYEDNSGRFAGVANFQYFGEVLDPELSNLRILTGGLGIRPLRNLSFDAIYHRYFQNALVDELEDTDLEAVPAHPNGRDGDLGHALDLVVGWGGVWDRLNLFYSFGSFFAGPAFDSDSASATLHRFQIRLDF